MIDNIPPLTPICLMCPSFFFKVLRPNWPLLAVNSAKRRAKRKRRYSANVCRRDRTWDNRFLGWGLWTKGARLNQWPYFSNPIRDFLLKSWGQAIIMTSLLSFMKSAKPRLRLWGSPWRSSEAQASAFWQTAGILFPGFLILDWIQLALHAADFQCQRKQSKPSASLSHLHTSL